MSRSFRSATKCNRGRTAVLAGLCMVMVLLAGNARSLYPAAYAQAPESVQHIVITLNKSILLPTREPFSSIQVDAPDIATARALTDHKIYIQAKNIGTTSVSMYNENMRLIKIVDIEVALDTGNIQSKIRAATGNNDIHVSNDNGQIVLTGTASDAVAAQRAVEVATTWARSCGQKLGGLAVAAGPGVSGGPNPGAVSYSAASSVNGSVNAAVPAAPPGGSIVGGCVVVNAMTIAGAQQVQLKVRFLEVSRDAGRELGVNWNGINAAGTRGFSTGLGGLSTASPQSCGLSGTPCPGVGSGLFQTVGTLVGTNVGAPFGTVLAQVVNSGLQIDALVTALETKGLLQRLAEPNLIALSGDSASFRAGGDIPVPIAVTSAVGIATPTIEYKDFGVLLQFRPTVLNNGIINVSINPEVSELDFSNAITISGTTVPALTLRNATTTVELRDGQSFAIAGLLQADNTRNISQLPWLGSVPVLGTLFRSSAYQKSETDLVIIVTPSLVRPAAPGARLATPFDNHVPSNDVDFFLLGELEQRKKYNDFVAPGGNVQGPYGYMLGVSQGPNPSNLQK